VKTFFGFRGIGNKNTEGYIQRARYRKYLKKQGVVPELILTVVYMGYAIVRKHIYSKRERIFVLFMNYLDIIGLKQH